MELVTIIVAAYNVENYINKCVNSLMAQTYQNIEMLLVDDGSTDNTGMMIEEKKKGDSRIKVFHKTNGGLSDARNYGLDRMTGRYVTFVDADDFVPQNYIEHMVSIIEARNADVAVVRTCEFCDEKDINLDINYDFVTVSCEEAVRRMLTRNGIAHTACGKLYKVELWESLRFPYRKLYEDYHTTFDAFSKASTVAISEARIYFYFQRPGSIMHYKCNERTVSIVEATREVTPRIIKYWPDLEVEALDLQLALCLKCYQNILNSDKNSFFDIQREIANIVSANGWRLLLSSKTPMKDKVKVVIYFMGKKIFLNIYKKFDGSKWVNEEE